MDMGSSSMAMDMATSTGSSMPIPTSDANMSMAMNMEQMNMVFFISTTTPLWTKSFTPNTTGQYAGVCIFLIVFATVSRMLLALRVNFYTIRAAAERRRNQGLLAEPKGAIEHETMTYRPWRAKEAIMLGFMDFVIVGVSYLLMLAVMTMNVGYFLSVLAGVFVGSVLFGRFSGSLSDH